MGNKLKHAAVVAILLSSKILMAFEVARESNKLILRANTCDETIALTKSLADWSTKEGSTKVCRIPSTLTISDDKTCKLDISDCVPDFIAKYLGEKSSGALANCFNTALVFKGILKPFRFVNDDEMDYYLSSPLCRQVKNDEQKNAGDIGLVKETVYGHQQSVHAFIWVSNKISFAKPSMDPSSLYSLNETAKDSSFSDVQCKNLKDTNGEICPREVSYYRCISVGEYLKSNPLSVRLYKLEKQISAEEKCIYLLTNKGLSIPKAARQSVLNTVQALEKYVSEEGSKNKSSDSRTQEEAEFKIGMLVFRLEGIYVQSWNSGNNEFGQEMGPLRSHLRDSLRKLKEKNNNR
ncbi:MAG: hypothetical protein ACXVCY_08660 [Pseudobdellovibrionaceae bacterium]